MPFTGNEELKMQEGSVFLFFFSLQGRKVKQSHNHCFNYTPVKGSVSEEAKGFSVHLQQGKGLKMLFQSYYSVYGVLTQGTWRCKYAVNMLTTGTLILLLTTQHIY